MQILTKAIVSFDRLFLISIAYSDSTIRCKKKKKILKKIKFETITHTSSSDVYVLNTQGSDIKKKQSFIIICL